jgi:hypothetical protein
LIVFVSFVTEGESRKEKEQELKAMMKRLEAKYQALQVVPVIGKFGNQKVCGHIRHLLKAL